MSSDDLPLLVLLLEEAEIALRRASATGDEKRAEMLRREIEDLRHRLGE